MLAKLHLYSSLPNTGATQQEGFLRASIQAFLVLCSLVCWSYSCIPCTTSLAISYELNESELATIKKQSHWINMRKMSFGYRCNNSSTCSLDMATAKPMTIANKTSLSVFNSLFSMQNSFFFSPQNTQPANHKTNTNSNFNTTSAPLYELKSLKTSNAPWM